MGLGGSPVRRMRRAARSRPPRTVGTADINATLHNLPDSVCTPELHISMREGEAHQLVAKLQENAHFEGASEVIRLDGLRVEYPDGFGLIRASNTTPSIVLRFEAENAEALARIQDAFRSTLAAAAPRVEIAT